MLFSVVIGGPMLYKMPPYRSSKIFATRVFWRLRNHTFDGHISGLEQDRNNMIPLLRTKSPMPHRLVPLPSRSRDDTTSGLVFLAFQSHNNRRKRGHGDLAGGGTWTCVTAKPEVAVITFMPHTVGGRTPNVICITSHSHLAA